ncbi:MAG: molybdopterin-dependent oxidoreductase [Chloroflexales bacterium]|nr:molybdopterin-dependent oxidoreductase [Chloroflexales bacterium]
MSKQQTSQPTEQTKRCWRMTRRGFLIGAGATAATLALGIPAGLPWARLQIASIIESGEYGPSADFPSDPFAWFEVTLESRLRLFITKVEMGQGIHMSMAQVAAEELGIDWVDLDIVQAGTAVAFADTAGTGASTSVATTFTSLRQAAVTFRHLLQQANDRPVMRRSGLFGNSATAGGCNRALFQRAEQGSQLTRVS